jgi:hypothetical protein
MMRSSDSNLRTPSAPVDLGVTNRYGEGLHREGPQPLLSSRGPESLTRSVLRHTDHHQSPVQSSDMGHDPVYDPVIERSNPGQWPSEAVDKLDKPGVEPEAESKAS